MEEKNREMLSDALRQLPTFQPRQQVWDKIVDDLEAEESSTLRKALKSLPTHSPSEKVWSRVMLQVEGKGKGGKVLKLNNLKTWVAAASIAVVVSLGFWWSNSTSNQSDFVLTVSEEASDPG